MVNKQNYQKTAKKYPICETKIFVTNIKTKYFNKINTMHMHNMNTRK